MKILGIDFGLKKIGLAQSEGELASPLDVWYYQTLSELQDKISSFCQTQGVKRVVFGLPEKSVATQPLISKINILARHLQARVKLEVFFEPEVYTTQTAKNKLIESQQRKSRRRQDDDFAAAVILQSFLDRK